jgi:hypothetical protein
MQIVAAKAIPLESGAPSYKEMARDGNINVPNASERNPTR